MYTNALLTTLMPLLVLAGCTGKPSTDVQFDTAVVQEDDTAAPVPDITVDPLSLDLGVITEGEGVMATFTVENVGAAPLDASAAVSSGDPLFTVGTSTFTVFSGDSEELTVYFSSPDEGVYTGQVTVVSNDPDEPAVVVYLGVVVNPPVDDDLDDDGYASAEDCDDTDASVNPGADEIWYNGTDENCDGASDYDADGDSYDSADYGADDCDDTNAGVSPGTLEDPTNGLDDNCDGTVDETTDVDVDGDGYTADAGDCDDNDASVNPDAAEIWYDGVDQDCDTLSDYDADSDGEDSDLYSGTDCDDVDPAVNTAAVEIDGNGIDDDCDGIIDIPTSSDDLDGDGYLASVDDCDDADAAVNPGAAEVWYDGVDQDCDTLSDYDADYDGEDSDLYSGTDCDDADAAVNTAAVEIDGNGIDDDCDGIIDIPTSSDDLDGDGYLASVDDCDDADAAANPGAAEVWYDGVDQNCDGLSDYDQDSDGVTATLAGGLDCDDVDATVNPSAVEVCDGVDNDCDGTVDDGLMSDWYADADADGYGRTSASTSACAAPAGYVSMSGDCDDSLADVNPGEVETCNSRDDDCDGLVDDGVSSTWYLDADGDTYGTASTSASSCTAPSGYVAIDTDCNDADGTINPAAAEVCDGVDQDCDSVIDDGTGTATYYLDLDGDGFGDPATAFTSCSAPTGAVADDTDCDDADSSAYPGALEIAYDITDNDCDGYQDDMVAETESDWTVLGERASDGIGSWGVATTEDLDGDGEPELVIAAGSANTSSRTDAGYIAFHDADAAGLSVDLTDGYYYMYGSDTSDFYGSAFVVVDDLDGDGNTEVAVGSYQNDSNESADGQVYLFDIDGESGSDQASSGSADGVIRGESDNGYLGYSLAAGDFDGDGMGDLATGAPGEQSAKGRVYVTFDGDDLGTDELDATDSNFYITGVSNSDHLGYSVAFGDLTGDGHDDLVACSPDDDDNGSASGTCWVVAGASTRGSSSAVRGSTVSSVDTAVITGNTTSDQVGYTPQSLSIGDFDGDGGEDLAVGVPGYDGSSTDGGGVWIYDGASLSGSETVSTATWVATGDGALGTAVNMTDVTGDGVDDLLAGATTAGASFGLVYLLEGGLTAATYALPDDQYASWIGAASGDAFGAAISGVLDLDGDGRDEFAVSASGNDDAASAAGKVYVIPAYP